MTSPENTNHERTISQYLVTDHHEVNLETLLVNQSTSEFESLLAVGRTRFKNDRVTSWSILSCAAELGLELGELGRNLRLPAEVIQKLDLHLLHAASIPERLFDLVSEVLMVPADFVRNYVLLPPAVPVGTRFYAESREPQVVLETFEDALVDDDDLLEDDRDYWLGDKC